MGLIRVEENWLTGTIEVPKVIQSLLFGSDGHYPKTGLYSYQREIGEIKNAKQKFCCRGVGDVA